MARLISLFSSLALLFGLSACDSISGMLGGEEEEETPETANPPESTEEAMEQVEELQAAAEEANAAAVEAAQAQAAAAVEAANQAAQAGAAAANEAAETAEEAGEAAEAAAEEAAEEATEAANEATNDSEEAADDAEETATAMVAEEAEGGGTVQAGMLQAAGGRGTLAACESEDDPHQCVINRLEGRARYATEMAALISAYSAKGRGGQAVPVMQDFLRRFPTDRRADRYRTRLQRMGIQPAR
ncbi:MAG: hypothetical protein AAGF12_13685 [Myxococcota bacterium]